MIHFYIDTSKIIKKPAIGDTRTTKKYGLQIRVVDTDGKGQLMRNRNGYYYVWRTPRQLVGTRWEHLVERIAATE
jgi:hypothetical protein